MTAKFNSESFWSNVKKQGDCLLWKGSTFQSGYGRVGIDYKSKRAHRVAFEYTYGAIPEGLVVCHKCDVRLCVNPSHLFLGTVLDNVEDKMNKNRQAKGESMGRAKLTNTQVINLRKLHSAGIDANKLAKRFKVTTNHVHDIVSKRSWKHL